VQPDAEFNSEDFEDEYSDEDALLLSPVSRWKRSLSKLKWNWYDDEERKPDQDGWTELDRRLRRNHAPRDHLNDHVLMALGGYTGPLVGMSVLRDCERLNSADVRPPPGGVAGDSSPSRSEAPSNDGWWGMPSLTIPRSAFAAAVSDGTVYALGGQANDASNKCQGAGSYKKYVELASVERLQLRPRLSSRWQCGVVPDMLRSRVGHAAAVLNGRLYGKLHRHALASGVVVAWSLLAIALPRCVGSVLAGLEKTCHLYLPSGLANRITWASARRIRRVFSLVCSGEHRASARCARSSREERQPLRLSPWPGQGRR